jgi:hypothetical protein
VTGGNYSCRNRTRNHRRNLLPWSSGVRREGELDYEYDYDYDDDQGSYNGSDQ